MASPYEMFKTDKDLECVEGVTIDYGDFKIKLHRAGGSNKKFGQVLTAKMKPHRRKVDQGVLDEEIGTRILAETYAESVVIGWDGVVDQAGKKMPFTVENCVKLLTDLPELFKDIQEQAATVSNFRKDAEELEAKNLPKS